MKASLALSAVLLVACGHIDDPPPQNAQYRSWASTPAGEASGASPATATTTSSADLPAPVRGPMVVASQPDGRKVDDRRLADQIKKTLLAEPSLKNAELDRVRVMTDSGKVTLNGLVPSVADSTTIEQKIRSIKGVMAVDNQLETIH